MADRTEYHAGKTGSIVRMIQAMIKRDPTLIDDYERLRATIVLNAPALANKENCWNCDASMKEYIYHFDVFKALLLIRMAEEVRNRQYKGMAFSEANQVRIPELPVSHAIRCQTTQASKLGLIAQLRSKTGTRIPGVWVVTRRGWEALAGKPVPAKVKVWRKAIEEHFEETTTIAEALRSHVETVEKIIKKGRSVREDHRDVAQEYNPETWYQWTVHQGAVEI